MGAYLTDHPPVRDQWYAKRNRALTGCTVLHTAESVMDTVGPDTGAEAVAEFIRTRTTAGSYHDLVDSDSWIPLVDLKHGAYHDGTGSNNWALSISFACATSDWRAMSPAKRRGFLRQGARAFANQQAYRGSIGAPLTELRLISKAQSDRGESGFTYHGLRDPGRRTDPGVAAPNLFPFDEFITECRAAMAGDLEDDDMFDPNVHIEAIARAIVDRQVSGDRPLWQVLAALDSRDPMVNPIAQAVVDRTVVGDLTLWQWAQQQAKATATLSGQVAGLQAAVVQLAAAPASAVDLDAVFKAAQDGARSVIDNLRVVAQPNT